LINDLCLMIGVVFITYDQFISGAQLSENTEVCLQSLEQYLYLQAVSLVRGMTRKTSLLKKETTMKKEGVKV
jgi:hypothetical protein